MDARHLSVTDIVVIPGAVSFMVKTFRLLLFRIHVIISWVSPKV